MGPIAGKRAHLPLTKNKLLRAKANKVERRTAKHQATNSASEVAFVPVAAVHLCVAFGLKCARTNKGARGTMASDLADSIFAAAKAGREVAEQAFVKGYDMGFRKGYDTGRDHGKDEIEKLRKELQKAKELVLLYETRAERFRGYLAEIEADAGRRVRPRTDPRTDPLA